MAYRVVRRLFAIIFSIFFRWDIKGRENIPQTGPFILCANHFSWWDPPLVGCLTTRQARFMAKEELFKIPLLGKILVMIRAFPVKRNSADRRAIKTALAALSQNEGLGLFPEGTRSRTGELLPPEPGVGLIAVKSEAPVVPIGIIGPYKLFRRIRVRIGKPLRFDEYYGVKVKSEQLDEVANRIMQGIREQLQP